MSNRTHGEATAGVNAAQLNNARKTLTTLSAAISTSRTSTRRNGATSVPKRQKR